MTDAAAARLRAGDLYEIKPPQAGARLPASSASPSSTLRVMQWNIERGYQMQKILKDLQEVNADVLALQELDIACRRSGFCNVARKIADTLGYHCVFLCEFEELQLTPDVRSPENAAGPQGKHGNAILSRFPITRHGHVPHSAGIDWEARGHEFREPRRGNRGVVWAEVELPTGGSFFVYCAHFEVFCGARVRVRQYLDVLRLARSHFDEVPVSERETTRPFRAAICGDFNTMAHSIVVFSPKYANDRMRFTMWGQTEGEWFARQLLERTTSSLPSSALSRWIAGVTAADVALLQWAWTTLRMTDPFDVYHTVTLNHPKYRGMVQGKLDWLLITASTSRVAHCGSFNLDYSASDHRGLWADVSCDGGADATVPCARLSTARQLLQRAVVSAILGSAALAVVSIKAQLGV